MFAAVLMLAISCSEYDDSALLGRVDELEGRVDGYEQRLSELESKVNNINESYKALTAMLNGGVITSVESFNDETGSGYAITIQYAAGTPTTYKIYNGTKGETSDTPVVELKEDTETGRYYWVINGEEPFKEHLYADVVTPQLQIDDDGNFQISYDGGETWEDIGVFGGELGSDITMDVEKDNNGNIVSVTFTQGENEWTYEVGASNMAVALTVDGKSVKPFSSVSVEAGKSKTIAVAVEGASGNAIVTAELQNAGGYNVTVEDMEITVECVDGGVNKLIINVLDGGACYHTWVVLTTGGAGDGTSYMATITAEECDEDNYIPAAYGSAFASVKAPIEPTVTLNITPAASQDLVLNLGVGEDIDGKEPFAKIDASMVTMPKTVTVKKGESSVNVPVSIKREMMTRDVDYYLNIAVTADNVETEEEATAIWFANDISVKAVLTGDDLSCEWTHGGESERLAYLVDGDIIEKTKDPDDPEKEVEKNYWESVWWVGQTITTHPDYHIYIDIQLPHEVAVVQFKHYPRPGNTNVAPTSLKYASVVDGKPVEIGTKKCDTTVDWQTSDKFALTTPSDNVWFGIIESAQGSLAVLDKDVNKGYCYCAGLIELEVWVMY